MIQSPFDQLAEFPFRRLAALLRDVAHPDDVEPLDFSIGEPKMPPPAILAETVAAHSGLWNRYPPINGTELFRRTVKDWLDRRYNLPSGFLDPDNNILSLSGTKEGLFLLSSIMPRPSAAQEESVKDLALMPDPVYSVYVGSAALAGLQPVPLRTTRATGFLPDLASIDPQILATTATLTVCSPANPQGVIASREYLTQALELARHHDFLLILDECYAEIYRGDAPVGGLEIARDLGGGCRNLVVMHSLSKRSNAAGLRSGFVAGDAEVIAAFARLRAYGASTQPMPLMAAAIELWRDERHVDANRQAYAHKIAIAERILGNRFHYYHPPGGFFLWLDVGCSIKATRRLWAECALRVLPGEYLTAGDDEDGEAGGRYIRIALVHDDALIEQGLNRLVAALQP